MEEKKFKGLPKLILWIVNAIIIAIIAVVFTMFKLSLLTFGGLVSFIICIVLSGAICSVIHTDEIKDEACDMIEELKSKIDCLNGEIEELKNVVKNYQKQPNKRNIKKISDDRC